MAAGRDALQRIYDNDVTILAAERTVIKMFAGALL